MELGSRSSAIEDGKRAQTTIQVVFDESAGYPHRLAAQGRVGGWKKGKVRRGETGQVAGEAGSKPHRTLGTAVNAYCPPTGEAEPIEPLLPTTGRATAESRRHPDYSGQFEKEGADQIATAAPAIKGLETAEEE